MNSHVPIESIKTSSVNSPQNLQHGGTKMITIVSDGGAMVLGRNE